MRALLPVVFGLSACVDYNLDHKNDNQNGLNDSGLVLNEPDIEVTPTSLSFEPVPQRCPAPPQEVTVRNRGTDPLEVSDIAVTNNTEAMSLDISELPFTLEGGGETTFRVNFAPPGAGDFSGELTVYSNDPDEPEVGVNGDGRGVDGGVFEEVFFQEPNSSVDVIWVVDNSGSMSDVVDHLSSRFQDFIDPWLELGEFDWQMGVITTDMDNPLHQGQLQGSGIILPSDPDPRGAFLLAVDQGDSGSGTERGFDAVVAATSEPLISTTNAGLLRDGVPLYVIFVSDEDDDSNMNPSTFLNTMAQVKGGDPSMVTVAAFCGAPGFPGGCSGTFDWSTGIVTASAADEYVEAVESTDGTWASICADDFSPALSLMATRAAGMNDTFYLSGTPGSLATLYVYVDGVEAPYSILNGWTYESDINAVVFHGDSLPPAESVIEVSYEVAGGCDG